jgi:hypothetical protein
VGRAVWAAGAIAGTSGLPERFRVGAERLLDRLVRVAPRLADVSPRACAYAVLGLTRAPATHRQPVLAHLVGALADAWHASATVDWCWPEDRLTYDNARLVQAMLRGSVPLRDGAVEAQALASLDWYVHEVGLDRGMLRTVGNRWRHRSEQPRRADADSGDEQPIDAAALVDTLADAWRLTGRRCYAVLALRAYRWFLGHNRLAARLYHERTGGCLDGLGLDAPNLNQGAESTLAYYQATLALARAGLAAVVDGEGFEEVLNVHVGRCHPPGA